MKLKLNNNILKNKHNKNFIILNINKFYKI